MNIYIYQLSLNPSLSGWIAVLLSIFFITGAAIFKNKSNKLKLKKYISKIEQSPKDIKMSYSKNVIWMSIFTICFCIIVIYYHYLHINRIKSFTGAIVILAFFWTIYSITCALRSKHYSGETPALKSTILIPVYNEDVASFHKVLESIVQQTILPTYVYIIDDGSAKENCVRKIVEDFREEYTSIEWFYTFSENRGKRNAQYIGYDTLTKNMKVSDVIITVDSDTILDKYAIENGLKPFVDENVMSVAGMLFNQNNKTLLAKTTGLGFASSFTTGRAFWSHFSSVAVSCGGLAFYRDCIFKEYREHYLTQKVLGHSANYGDDRMMTQFASLEGKTVFQETSIGYTLLPVTLSHLTRQRTRWWKSFWWGGLWLLGQQSIKRPIFWLVLQQYISFVLYAFVFVSVFIITPIKTGALPFEVILYMIFLSYLRMITVFRVERTDQSTVSRILEYCYLVPLSTFLNFYICTILQYVSLFKLKEVKQWGTRQSVEVKMEDS